MRQRFAVLSLFMLMFCVAGVAQQIDPSLYSGMRWRMIGPFRGGRAITAAGVAGKPNLYYFGAVGGGVWKSTDAGVSWQPIFDDEPIASIGALAIAPSDVNTIYVGSGEADMRSQITYGNGMYKSTDAGVHWQHIGLDDSQQIGKIIVDPKDANRLFVAVLGHAYGPNAERGVFRSLDGGAHWEKVLYKNGDTGAIDLAFDPGDAHVLYASLWQTRRPPWAVYPPSNGPDSGLYKSTDGGNTWKQLNQGLPTERLGRIGIGVSPSDARRVYLVVDAKQGGVYRSDDGGGSFHLMDDDHRVWQRGWYFGGITVDPKNADVVYVANTSSYKSVDGGKDFVAFKGAPGGDDYHSIWIAPEDSQRIIIASDQGTIVSLNGGATWSSWYNQPTAQIYRVTTDNRFPYWVYGAQQDSGAVALPSRSNFSHIGEHDWRPLSAGGESGSIAADPLHQGTLFGGTVTKYEWTSAQEQDVSPTLGLPGTFRRTWTLPLAFSKADPKKLYMAHQFIFRTIDGGNSWQQISPDLTRADAAALPNLDAATAKDVAGKSTRRGVVYALGPSPIDAKLLWAGTDDGLIQLTRDDGSTWQNVTPSWMTPWSKVASMEGSRFDAGTAYAAIDRHRLEDYKPYVLRTRDFGKSWAKLGVGIPDGAFVNVVREDPVRQGLLYAGTELGAYISFDGGEHWQTLKLNMPAVSVRDITVHGDDVVIATHGRGFWILDDATPLREVQPAMSAQAAHLYKPQAALRVRPPNDEGTPQPPETPKGENPPSGAIVDYYVGASGGGPLTLAVVDAKGMTVRHWSSEDKVQPVDPKSLEYPAFWVPTPEVLSSGSGMHRWLWDMHYAAPQGVSGGRRRRGTGAGAWAPPAAYRVRMTYAGKSYEQRLLIEPDPRIHAEQNMYEEQFATAQRALDDAAKLAPALAEAGKLRKQIETQRKSAQGKAEVLQALDQLSGKLDAAAGPAAAAFGEEMPEGSSLQSASGDLMAVFAAVESADAPPTVTAQQALARAEQAIPAVLQNWTTVSAAVQAANERLRAAGAAELKM